MFIVVVLLFSFSTALYSVDLCRMYRRGHHFMLCICMLSFLWLLPINACILCISVFNVFHFWMSSNNKIQLHCYIPHIWFHPFADITAFALTAHVYTLHIHSSRNNRTGWDESALCVLRQWKRKKADVHIDIIMVWMFQALHMKYNHEAPIHSLSKL